ncbi:response regulator [Halomicrobium sp. IBSBa]|nr:response regulator [Halomicrobium sp. IBSBa]
MSHVTTPSSGREQLSVLVVDDSEFFAEMTAETLAEDHDFGTHAASDPKAALDYFSDNDVDCIVSDYEMPGMDGLEFLDAVREREPDIPFILLTGRGDEEVASEAIAAGVTDYLLKLEVVEDKQYGRLANRIRNVVSKRRTQAKYELLVDTSPDLIAQVAEDGTILAANPAMAEFTDISREELVGQTLAAVLGAVGEDRTAVGQSVIEDGDPTHAEDQIDGRSFHNIYVPIDVHSHRPSFQLVSRDITERVERERELKRQNERLEEFASVVSHDMRNPLNVAQSALQLLEKDRGDDAELQARLTRSLDRMESLIDDVLTLAREGETVDDPSVVDLGTIARESWMVTDSGEAELVVDSTARIQADDGRLGSIFSNLYGNAVDHGCPPSDAEDAEDADPVTITVSVTDDGFVVADDGCGMDLSTDDDPFEMGYSTDTEGTGMGLTIVERVAEAHGWSVELGESEDGGLAVEISGVTFVD